MERKELIRELLLQNDVTMAKAIEHLPIDDVCDVLEDLGSEKASEVFAYLPLSVKQQVILTVNRAFIYNLVEYLFTDDLTELIEESDETVKAKILGNASTLKRRQLLLQLQFKDNSAGALMSMDFVEIAEDDTAAIAMHKIKAQEKIAETISYCYVTNEQHTLLGIVSMRDILLSAEDVVVKNIMETDLISVDLEDDQEIVAQVMSKYDLVAIPVVNQQHQILGIVTIDDIMDIMTDEITEDIHKMGGVTPTDKSYLEMSAYQISKSRILWLLILMISATISGEIINFNADITLKLPSLLIFMPMLMDTAGNAGSQSSAMVIRGIIVDQLTFKNLWVVLRKELISSVILGSILFIVNLIRIIIFMPNVNWQIGALVSLTVFIIVLIANLIGGLLPLLAVAIKFDPASMSGPVLTTVCDAISLIIYFSLASFYLGGVI